MAITYFPQLGGEASLPVYVTGVGIGLDMSSTSALPHSDARLIITVSGCGTVTVGDEKIILSEGSGIYIGKNVDHKAAVRGDGGWTVDLVSLEIPSDELLGALFTRERFVFFSFKRPAMISEDIRKILEAVTRDQSYGGYFASATLYSMLVELNKEHLDFPTDHEKHNASITSAINHINTHYMESLSLDELCKVAGGLSEQYFCRLFKQHTGTRPVEYILRKRISVARSYLEKTDMPISDIAKLTGFNNASYFYRNFKKFTGVSPLACRQGAVAVNTISQDISDT